MMYRHSPGCTSKHSTKLIEADDQAVLPTSYANEGEVKMTKQEIISMIERAGFEAVERDTVYNRVEKIAA